MATLLVLRHPDEDQHQFPTVRLMLMDTTLVMDVAWYRPSTQILPSRAVAEEHLERMLRLRLDEGYRLLERREIPDAEVEQLADPMAQFFRYDARGRAHVNLEEGPASREELAEVVAHMAALAPVGIEVMRSTEIPGGLLGAAFAGSVLPSVQYLIYSTTLHQRHTPPLDDLASLWAALPNLDRVDALGMFTLGTANHAALRELHLDGLPLWPETLAALGAGVLPALTTLGLLPGEDHGLDRAIAAALRSVVAPRLRAIQVTDLADVTCFLAELTKSPLPASWTMLCVRGTVPDEDDLLALLRERAPALRTVAMLGLPLTDDLSEGGVVEVRSLLPGVVDVCDLPDLRAGDASNAW